MTHTALKSDKNTNARRRYVSLIKKQQTKSLFYINNYMSKFHKIGLMCASALIPMSIMAQEYPASTSAQIYDQTPWDDQKVLKLFAKAYEDGRNYPTKAEFEEIGLTMDLEFVRSHTRQRPVYFDASKDIVQDINHNRRLWCNLPAGYGKGTGGYPSIEFDQDVFSFWNYTNLFGAWNYGFLQAPGAWIDAAHKNGTRMYGGIAFFESWNNDGSEDAFQKFITTKNEPGSEYTYTYSRAFVNAAAFFGSDGYNYNSEGTIYQQSDFVNFHAEVKKISNDLNILGFGIGQYTMNAGLDASNIGYLYGNAEKGEIYDCMLNYSGNLLYYRGVPGSIAAVEAAGLSMDNVYQGHLLVGLDHDYWVQMNNNETQKRMNVVIWGEHDQSRFFQFRVGDDPMSIQSNYQKLMEKAFSGANRNPLLRPEINNNWGKFQVADPSQANEQLNNSPGFASMFAERTAIGPSLPFETNFALGNGESYFYKGKVTHGSWYNMSQQDIVPTYRWLVTAKGDMATYANEINVEFTHEDAYMAGSSIRLSGSTVNGNDIVLYRTNLKATEGNVKVDLAVKSGKEGENASNLSVILRKAGSDEWIEVPYGTTLGKTWEAKTMEVAGIAKGDVIEYIGLRVNGGTTSDYSMLVGHLKVSDDRKVEVAPIRDNSLVVEVKEETTASLSVKLNWEPNYDGYTTSIDKFGMVYNDEVNIDHFEIMFKEGENGKIREIGRTAQWATYIGNIPMEQSATAFIGVRSVSVDLKTVSPIQWVAIPRYAGELPDPQVEDPYGKTWMSSVGNGTLETCIEHIWVEKVTTSGATQNLNYVVTSNPLKGVSEEQYYFAADHKLVVEQGQTITINYKGNNSGTPESLQYDFVNAYIDYDGNYSFLDADETIGKFGNLNQGTIGIVEPGLELTITIPADAKPGESRLRIVGSDAWTAHPGPTGGTVKGYSIDFPMEIVGENPGRKGAETYKDRRDQGEAEEPENTQMDSIEEVGIDTNTAFSSVSVVDGMAYFVNTDKAWFYTIDGRCVKHVADAKVAASVADLTKGVYVVKMQNGQIVRSSKVIVK